MTSFGVEEMYVVPPPQRSDPGSNSDLRVYQTWKGSNVSFFFFLFSFFHFFSGIFFYLLVLGFRVQV